MKQLLFIMFIFPSLCFSQQQNDTLSFYRWGMIIFDEYINCEMEASSKLGFRFEWVGDGCEVTLKESKKWEKHNNNIEKQLIKRHGKNWEAKFSEAITVCKYQDVITQKGYKNFNDKKFQEGDLVLAPLILFDFDGAEILKESIDSVKVIADFIKKHPNLKIEIGLHMDSQGNEEYNRKISELRGRSIEMVLQNNFKNENNYTIKGYGESQPLIPERAIKKILDEKLKDEFHRINRRIEIKILKVD